MELTDKNHFKLQPVDSGVPKLPNRFKLSVRTGNPLLWVSQNLPANEAADHPLTVDCKEPKKSVGSRKALISPIVHCGLVALEVTNLNVVAIVSQPSKCLKLMTFNSVNNNTRMGLLIL